jgi:hypothetical protein
MADSVEQPIIAAIAAAPEVTPAPSATIPETVAPVQPDLAVAATPTPDASETPADASGEAVKPETKPTEEGFKPTLLEGIDKPKEEVKPVEAKADEKPAPVVDPEAPETEVVPEQAPALHPIDYWADEGGVKLPDTLKLDDKSRTDLTAAFDAFRADPTKGAQAIIDQGVKVITDAQEQLRRDQWTVFNDTQTEWQNQVMADPILGGTGHDTAMLLVGQGRNKLVSAHPVGSEGFTEDVKAFNEMARITGVGNHPAFLKLLHRAGKLFAEAAPPPPDPRPAPDNGRRPGNKAETLYTKTTFPKSA